MKARAGETRAGHGKSLTGPASLFWWLGPTQIWTWGICYYTFSVMVAPMTRELGWSVAEINGALSLSLMVSALSGLVMGRLFDLHGPRNLLLASMVLSAFLVMAWSRVDNLAVFYLVWIGMGLIVPCIQYESLFWLANHEKDGKKRQAHLGLITFFGGLASTVLLPLSSLLLVNLGWRNALLVLGVLLLAGGFLPAFLTRKHFPVPEGRGEGGRQGETGQRQEAGRHAEGNLQGEENLQGEVDRQVEMQRQGEAAGPGGLEIPLRDRIVTWSFGLFALALGLSGLAWSALSTNIVSLSTSRGLDPLLAASCIGLVGLVQVAGRLVFGLLGGRWSLITLAAMLCLFQVLSVVLLLVLPQPVNLIGFALAFGLGHGIMTPVRAALIPELFGAGNFGTLSGMTGFVTSIGRAAGPVLFGLIIMYSGSSDWALVSMMGASLLAMVLLSVLGVRRKKTGLWAKYPAGSKEDDGA